MNLFARLRAWRARRRWFQTAVAYNAMHTFEYSGPCAATWMCPNCHSVHRSAVTNKFSGRQFPACCQFEAGGRLERRHAISFRR